MIKAVTLTLGLAICLGSASDVFAQAAGQDTAINEGVRRQAAQINLREKLDKAAGTYARGDLPAAAKLYDEAWELVLQIGPGAAGAEAEVTQAGVARTRMEMARAAQHRGDLLDADRNVKDVLRVDPANAVAQDFKQTNDRMLLESRGKFPSQDLALAHDTVYQDEKAKVGTMVQDGKLLFQMGKLDEAEAKLREARKIEPQNEAAYYYLNAIQELRYSDALTVRDIASRKQLVEVEKAWATPPKRDLLPSPNPYARTNLTHTSKGRQAIMSKLDRIKLDTLKFDGLPLSEVIINLSDEAKKRDPEKRGINFIINPNVDAPAFQGAPAGAIDQATGLPAAQAAPPEPVDIAGLTIKINPPLTDLRLADALDAIVRVAGPTRIKYSIEDYAVVFSVKGAEVQPLFVRIIKVDPNTFEQGLQSVVGIPFANITVTAGTGGGSSGGGGGGGGQGGQNGQNAVVSIPRATLAPLTQGGGGGGGGGQQGGGGGNGILNVTRTNQTEVVQATVRQFFISMGIDLTPPKSIFFNDREGTLVVRATLSDLDTIETAVQVLNIAPPQVNIKTKFVEVTQTDRKALGFDWYLGNFLMNNNAIVGSGGTQPSFQGRPSTGNPEGTFPGSQAGGTFLAPLPSDGKVTSGIRNQVGFRNAIDTPALASITGILTDPQFRVVLRALEQKDGVDLLNESSVTTLSGRQTQIQVVDLQSIVTGVNLQQTAGGGGGNTTTANGVGGVGVVAPQVNYDVQVLPFGPTLDVVPYVSADGFTIQMTIIPTITEFLGYDDPGAFVPSAAAISGGAGVNLANQTLTATLPLPKFRLRQVTTSAIVWDGQTVVLGGLISDDVTKIKDKVPILGDLPLVGRLFRSESSSTAKRNLVIFVTPTIIDPAGNRFHSEDEMPFSANSIPVQKPMANAAP